MSKYPYLKRFLILVAIVVVVDAVICVLLWENDIIYYILWMSFAVIVIYKNILVKKIDEELMNVKGRHK